MGCFDGAVGLSSFTTVNKFEENPGDCIPAGSDASPFLSPRAAPNTPTAFKKLLAAKASAAKTTAKHHKRIQNKNKKKNKRKNGE